MANLGTLWFGADIDLTALRNKIQSGNQSILNALKMDYDPASYQQMVSKLRSTLEREVFQIKIDTNASAIQQNLRNTLNSVSNSASAPKMDLSGLKGISGMKSKMASLREEIVLQEEKVRSLRKTWQAMSNQYGQSSVEAKAARNAYRQAVDTVYQMRTNAGLLGVDIKRATIAQSELNKQTKEAAKAARQWSADHMRLNATLAGGVHISTQLGSALSSLFALDYMRQFLGYVIEIGGQLEKQRISIGAILGDTVKANHLFEQIKGLALKSPFGVVELDQYTKQLSAYGFRYNELYDMTKRLADISAGAGTDIGRLTLALGHVRSATYLTGITLRQFSMNNIPMLKMLADYYTEVEKKAVSTAEVQQRISKRQVSYEDVIEQIRRLTDEGGMFYNMQEKISESLAARYKNLKDAMDIMYGEMAEGTVGDILKGLASTLLKLTRHWREIANVMGVAAAAFMLSKLWIGANNIALQGNTRSTIKQIMTNKQLAANNLSAAATYRTLTTQEMIAIASSNSLTVADIKQALAVKQLTKEDVLRLVSLKQLKIAQAMHLVGINGITEAEIRAAAAAGRWKTALAGLKMSLKNAFSGLGLGTWATIGIMVGTELYSAWDQWNQRIDDKSNEMKDLIKSRIIDLQKMQKELDTNEKPKDQTALKGRIDEMKQVLANSEAYTKTIDEQLSKTSDLSDQYDILAGAIENAADKNRHMLDYQDDAAKMIKASKGEFEWSDVFKAGILSPSSFKNIFNQLFDEDIVTNIQDVNSAYKELRSTLESLYEFKEPLKEVIEDIMKSSNVSEDLKSQLKNAPFEEQLRILAENGYWDKIKEKIERTGKQFKMSEEEIISVAERLKGSLGKVADEWGEVTGNDIPKMFSKLAEIRGEDEQKTKQWALDNIDDFKMLMDGILDQVGEKEPSVRKAWKRMVYDYLRFSELEKGMAEGAKIGGSIFGNVDLEKLINDDEQANIKDDNKTDPTKGDKKDKQLEAARTRLQEYKSFLSEYKKYREIYSKEKAIDLLEQLFPSLKGQGAYLVDNYTDALDKLRDSLDQTTEARKKFANEVNKTKTDTLFDREKESIKKNADAMQDYIRRMEDQWKLYRSLMKKSGGNREFASIAFNENGVIWDETAKNLLERFNQRGEELGVIPVGFRWDMNEGELKEILKDANGATQDELVKLALEIQKIIRENYKQFAEDSASAMEKSLTATQKLLSLENQLAEKEKERSQYNGNDPAVIKGYDAQIEALKRQIQSQSWEAFKEQNNWGEIFGNLNKMPLQTIRKMIDAMKEYGKTAEMDVTETKAWYEALEKLLNREMMLDPIKSLTKALEDYQKAHEKRLILDQQIQRTKNNPGLSEEQKNKIIAALEKERIKLLNQEADALERVSGSIKAFSSYIKNLGSSLSQLGNKIGGRFGDIMNGVSGMFDNLSSGMDSIAGLVSASNMTGIAGVLGMVTSVLGITSATVGLVQSLDSILPDTQSIYEKYAKRQREINEARERIDDYNIAFLKAEQKRQNWLYNTELAQLRQRGYQQGKLLENYFNTVTASQEIYQDAKSGFSKWGAAIIGAIVAAGITVVTAGAGTAASLAILGNVISSGLATGTIATTIGAAVVAGAGAAIGTALRSGIDQIVYKEGQTSARANMRVQTQHRTFFRSEKTQNLEEWVLENYGKKLFSKEFHGIELIDVELAKSVLDSDVVLVGETRETLERIVELTEQIEEIQDQAHEYVSERFSPLVDNMTDSLWDWLTDGEDMLESFHDYASNTFAEIAKDAIKSFLKINLMDQFSEPLNDIYEAFSLGIIDEKQMTLGVANIAGQISDKFESLIPALQELGTAFVEAFDLHDIDITGSDTSRSSASNSIKSITENTADLLAAYINAMRADLSVIRAEQSIHLPIIAVAVQRTSVLAETQVTHLQQIAANTLRNADAADRIYDILHSVTPDGTRIRIA